MSDTMIIFITVGVVMLPVIWFLGGFLVKILWSIWPIPISLTAAGIGVWKGGLEYFVLIPASIIAGIVITWLWQRTSIYLKVDEIIGQATMLD